ncbi:MAG: hypothetical protein R3247_15580 [Rhodothermales bacterium]|nr:hypothetical protein [Rhodothermales bacterium]
MLRAEPYSLFSWDYVVYDGEVAVADIDVAWLRERAIVDIGDLACEVKREGWGSKGYTFEAGGQRLMRAVKPSAFFRRYEVTVGGDAYVLEAQSAFRRTFVLRTMDGVVLGTIAPDHPFTRRMRIDLPEALPLAVRVFLVWLVIVQWRRAASAGG